MALNTPFWPSLPLGRYCIRGVIDSFETWPGVHLPTVLCSVLKFDDMTGSNSPIKTSECRGIGISPDTKLQEAEYSLLNVKG